MAAWLAILPVGYFAWTLLHGPNHVNVSGEFDALDFTLSLVDQAARWIGLGFVFGALYARLPGAVGAMKATALGALFVLSQLAVVALPGMRSTYSPTFLAVESLVFMMIAGLLYDYVCLRATRADWRHLLDLYQVSRVHFSLT